MLLAYGREMNGYYPELPPVPGRPFNFSCYSAGEMSKSIKVKRSSCTEIGSRYYLGLPNSTPHRRLGKDNLDRMGFPKES